MCGTTCNDTFKNFNFIASINNLSIPVIVVLLSACSNNCTPSLLRLFESSSPEVLRPSCNPGPQCELHVLEVLEVPFAREVFYSSKRMEIA